MSSSSSLPFLQNIKKIVSRTTSLSSSSSSSSSGALSNNNLATTTTTTSSSSSTEAASAAFNKGITTLKTKVFDTILSEFQEKEWRCSCGHVFRASGEWQACEPLSCEAPRCPNPKFFLDGPGKSMLNKDGTVPLPQRVQALPESCKKGPKGSCGSSRFK